MGHPARTGPPRGPDLRGPGGRRRLSACGAQLAGRTFGTTDYRIRLEAAPLDEKLVERNTMRYYLAVEACLGTLDAPAAERMDKRLRAFHAGLERYPLQLRELELAEYLEIRRRDASRLQASQ